MKKLIYLSFLFCSIQINAYSQANITVDDEATVVKTVTIGDKINTVTEFNIEDTTDDDQIDVILLTADQDAFMDTRSTGMRLGTATSDITFRTNNTTFTRLKMDGNWGIGTGSPDARLHVSQGGNSGINNTVLLLESLVSKKPLLQFSEGGSGLGSGMSWYMNGSPTSNRLHINSSAGVELATFSNNFRFGINVIGDPTETLEVNGNIQSNGSMLFMEGSNVKSSLTNSGGNILLENNETNGDIEIVSELWDVRLETLVDDVKIDSGDDIAFRIDGVNKMFMRPSGRLGINNTSPAAMVDIKQIDNEDGLRIQDDSNSDDWSFDIGTNDLFLQFNNNDVGQFSDGSGTYQALSDRRLKKSIVPLEDKVLDGLLKLEALNYNYKDDESKASVIGFIAQDLMKDFPEVVTSWKNDAGEEYYSVSYDLLNVLIVKGVQVQNQEKERLLNEWNEIQDLESELTELNALISSLAQNIDKLDSKR